MLHFIENCLGKKRISQGCQIPLFYGVCYRDFIMNEVICYPLFINIFIAGLRQIYCEIAYNMFKSPKWIKYEDHTKLLEDMYSFGFEQGKRMRMRTK